MLLTLFSENVALNKPTTANSFLLTYPTWTAEKTVDGNRNSDIFCGSCLSTQPSSSYPEAYVRIDLGEVSSIVRVEIYNREPYDGQCSNGTKTTSTVREYIFCNGCQNFACYIQNSCIIRRLFHRNHVRNIVLYYTVAITTQTTNLIFCEYLKITHRPYNFSIVYDSKS